jgi:hypothetical protein
VGRSYLCFGEEEGPAAAKRQAEAVTVPKRECHSLFIFKLLYHTEDFLHFLVALLIFFYIHRMSYLKIYYVFYYNLFYY